MNPKRAIKKARRTHDEKAINYAKWVTKQEKHKQNKKKKGVATDDT